MSHDNVKKAARKRMAETGEPYTVARRKVIEEHKKQDAPAGKTGSPFGIEAGAAMAGFLRSIMQPEPTPGPPYIHVHKLPETEEEMAAAPFLPSLTIDRKAGR